MHVVADNERSTSKQNQNKVSQCYEPSRFTDDQRLERIKRVTSRLEQVFQVIFEKNHYPGLVYGIVVDGVLINTFNYGYSDIEKKIPTTSNSLFRIASMTKSLTAMAIVKLRDDGKLRLDDPISQYIPELPLTGLLINDAPTINIRHLLIQHSGMPEDDPWADRQLELPENEFLKMLEKGIYMSNPPGTIWEYTNLSYAMLGRIITVVSGIPYQEYIKQEILDVLDMKNTYWEYDDVPSELLARGYRWESNKHTEEALLHDGSFGAMGGLISSIEDFSKYLSYHLQAWPVRNEPEYGPIRRSSLREMQHPWNFIELNVDKQRLVASTCAYCYGLIWSKTSNNIVSINHSGGVPGYGSNWMFLPDYGIGIISFANQTYADLAPTNAITLAEIIDSADLKPRQMSTPKILDERKEQIVSIVLNQNWNVESQQLSIIFAENFFLDQTLELRKIATKELFDRAGNIIKIGDLIPKNQLRGHFLVECNNFSIQITFSLTPESTPLIQELKLSKIGYDA